MELLGVTTYQRPNPTSTAFPPAHGKRIAENELMAVGALDDSGRPWTTVWGGQRGFADRIAEGTLRIRALVDGIHDPVTQALLPLPVDGRQLPRYPDDASDDGLKLISGMSIDFESRDRVKVMGRLLAAKILERDNNRNKDKLLSEVQLSMLVQESTGNCPKYINRREVRTNVPSPQLLSESLPLSQRAIDLIHKADLFFMSSTNGDSMDTNHRGGPAGFLRVACNESEEDGGVVLVYPEYSGNRLYQSLGNLYLNPKIGIVVPDFETSDVLYLTGVAELLLGPSASEIMPHCKMVIRVCVQAARLVLNGMPFRGEPIYEMSPYDPPLRALACEPGVLTDAASAAVASAELLTREFLTPTISRFTFALHTPAGAVAASEVNGRQIAIKPWHVGQHVTLDFGGELDSGYMHMNAADPQSLNDDYVRTFTITNLPPSSTSTPAEEETIAGGTLLELTIRQHGPVTALLGRYDTDGKRLRIPVMGFGGDESFWLLPSQEEMPVFIAGGVGVTPLLAQAAGVLLAEKKSARVGLQVLWTLRAEDIPLAVDTFNKVPGLAARTKMYVTQAEQAQKLLDEVSAMGAEVAPRRIGKDDVLVPSRDAAHVGAKTKYYICTGGELSKLLLVWLAGQTVVSENFAY